MKNNPLIYKFIRVKNRPLRDGEIFTVRVIYGRSPIFYKCSHSKSTLLGSTASIIGTSWNPGKLPELIIGSLLFNIKYYSLCT